MTPTQAVLVKLDRRGGSAPYPWLRTAIESPSLIDALEHRGWVEHTPGTVSLTDRGAARLNELEGFAPYPEAA